MVKVRTVGSSRVVTLEMDFLDCANILQAASEELKRQWDEGDFPAYNEGVWRRRAEFAEMLYQEFLRADEAEYLRAVAERDNA